MGSRLDSLFEEDIEMQDALEDIGNLTDNSEDMILGVIEDRANEKESAETHLFTNKASDETNEDGLTEEEEREVAMALLNGDDDLGLDDDDLIDLALAD